MKELSIILVSIILLATDIVAQEEVVYDYKLNSISWNNSTINIPAGEPFTLHLIEVPKPADIKSIRVIMFNSKDKGKYLIDTSKVIGTFAVKNVKDSLYKCEISTRLAIRRNYYVKIEITDVADKDLSITKKVYTHIKKSKLSSFGVYGGIGAASFSPAGFKDIDVNPIFITGVKIHLKQRTNDDNLYRYIYGRASRLSIVIGTGVNDLQYKSTDIKSLFLGLKPAVGLDVEFNRHIGLTVGGIFGLQKSDSPFTDRNKPVAGLWLCLSLSADILKSFSTQSKSPNFSDSTQN